MEAKKSYSVETISKNSKKIQKSSSKNQTKKTSQFLDESESPKTKKYDTYSDNLKEIVVTELQQALMFRFRNEYPEESVFLNNLLHIIDEISLNHFNDYNQIIQKILTKHIPNFESTTANGASWRKKLKSWIKNLKKPERRGGKVIPPELSEQFLQELTAYLQQAPCRKFAALKSFILEFLEKYGNKPVKKNTCSKHWWFNYQNENPEIGQLWEGLQLERTINKKGSGKKNIDEEMMQSTDISSPSACSDHLSSLIDSQITSPQGPETMNHEEIESTVPSVHDELFQGFRIQVEDTLMNQWQMRPQNFTSQVFNMIEEEEDFYRPQHSFDNELEGESTFFDGRFHQSIDDLFTGF